MKRIAFFYNNIMLIRFDRYWEQYNNSAVPDFVESVNAYVYSGYAQRRWTSIASIL